MTPERKAWWDSLPKAEREVRQIIADNELKIKFNGKMVLQNLRPAEEITLDEIRENTKAAYTALISIRYHKHNIKLLRKQIGMNVVNLNKCPTDWGGRCPTCGNCRLDVFHNQHNCGNCGQKLRWV